VVFFFASGRRHTRWPRDWSSDVCSSDLFYVPDIGTAQEVNFTILGGMGEATTGGPVMNVMPKVGGNEFHGTFFANGSGAALQGEIGRASCRESVEVWGAGV